MAGRAPRVRIDRCQVIEGEKGYYDVVIEGFGLRPAITPPRIVVGGVPLEGVRFEEGGRRATGVLREQPRDYQVTVDLGYARAEGEANL